MRCRVPVSRARPASDWGSSTLLRSGEAIGLNGKVAGSPVTEVAR